MTGVLNVLILALLVSLVSSLVFLPLHRFRTSRPYAVYLLCLYVAFLILAVLVEMHVIHISLI